MPRVFDGVAATLNSVFGDPVTVTPTGGTARIVRGMFREVPIEDAQDDGRAILIMAPTLRLLTADAAGIGRGAEVLLGDLRTFTVLNRLPVSSPEANRFMLYELEFNVPE